MIPDFPVIETMMERRSVRSYDGKDIPAELKKQIMDYAARLENPFGCDVNIHMTDAVLPDTGEKLGTYGVIKGAHTFLGVSAPRADHALLASGYEFETLILYLTSLGLGTVWIAGTLSRRKFQEAMKIGPDELFPGVSPVGYPAGKRLFEKVMRKTLGSDKRKPWSELFFAGDFKTPLPESEADAYVQPLEMVRIAPSSTNGQPWRVIRIGEDYHFYVDIKQGASDDVVAIKHVDMGIALCHFQLACEVNGIKGTYVTDEPRDLAKPATYRYVMTWHPL